MADISDVDAATIKDLYERLEGLSCKTLHLVDEYGRLANSCVLARIMTRILY
jgi:hypothetical protein